MILEPGGGYLLVLTGLEQVYGEVGEVVARGAALGLMGARDHVDTDFLADAAEGGGIVGKRFIWNSGKVPMR